MFSSAKRFSAVIYFILLVNLADLGNFFLKYVLWLPSSHYLLAIRIFLVGFLSIIATREYYEFVTNPKCQRMGPYAWMFHFMLAMEWLIVFKFKEGSFTEPFPTWIIISWALIGTALLTIYSVLLYRDIKKKFFPTEADLIENKDKPE